MHSLALTGELTESMFFDSKVRSIERTGVDGIPSSVSKQLLNEDELWFLCRCTDEYDGK